MCCLQFFNLFELFPLFFFNFSLWGRIRSCLYGSVERGKHNAAALSLIKIARTLKINDFDEIVSAFKKIGWDKPKDIYEAYFKEQADGIRIVILAKDNRSCLKNHFGGHKQQTGCAPMLTYFNVCCASGLAALLFLPPQNDFWDSF